jgi:hypothetical protein
MTRTPRANDLRSIASDLRHRVQAGLSRKTAAYVGAGLAIAGVAGTSVAAGLSGTEAKQAVPAKQAAPAKRRDESWATVRTIVARRTDQKPTKEPLPAHDQLTPVAATGPQFYFPMTPARYQNAKTIVLQAIDRHMGLRSAVIAVATSMQESTLLNLKYGTSNSLGLFQQRPSYGWGTAAQIENPTHAADAFLKALHGYQAQNPDWAHQPLWQAAQGVQASGFPTAYAKWESEAAKLVATVSKHLI